MTDRTNALIVVLDENFRVDDVGILVLAISQMRGVASVGVNVTQVNDFIAQERAYNKLRNEIPEILYPTKKS